MTARPVVLKINVLWFSIRIVWPRTFQMANVKKHKADDFQARRDRVVEQSARFEQTRDELGVTLVELAVERKQAIDQLCDVDVKGLEKPDNFAVTLIEDTTGDPTSSCPGLILEVECKRSAPGSLKHTRRYVDGELRWYSVTNVTGTYFIGGKVEYADAFAKLVTERSKANPGLLAAIGAAEKETTAIKALLRGK